MVDVLMAELSGHDAVINLGGKKQRSECNQLELFQSDIFFYAKHVPINVMDG